MADEQELNVIVDPEEALEAVVEGAKPAATPADKPAAAAAAPEVPADPVVKDLAEQYRDLEAREQRQRESTERARRDAQAARQEADTAKAQIHDSRLETVTTALSSAETDVERAKADIKAAIEAGDAEAHTDAIDRLTTAKATILRLQEGKADIEARRTERKEPAKQKEPDQVDDPIEAYVQGRTKPTSDWLRAHPEFITNQRKNMKLNAAHLDATAEGYDPDTKEYFSHVEAFLGLQKPAEPAAKPNGSANGATQPKRSPAPPVAPGASIATNGGGSTPEVRLSAGEARAATDGTIVWNMPDPTGKNRWKPGDPIGIQEFARRKHARQQQGLD